MGRAMAAISVAAALVASADATSNFTELANIFTLLRRPLDAFGLNLAREIEISTPQGPLRGRHSVYGGEGGVFLGIPYAEQPVGDLRFKSPRPASSWTSVRDALEPGPACLQSHGLVAMDEACLFLNVFTPNLPAGGDDLLPVMVFFHGGSFVYGDGMSEAYGIPIYDGQAMANLGNVVVVTINYRLGALGFLALDALKEESPEDGTGNYGLQDQREALRWVQRNIAAFGGDRERVMIFGESAGAMSVMFHVTSPRSRGLFRAALMESGDEIGRTWEQATEEGRVLAKSIGCDPAAASADLVACLRGKDARAVQGGTAREIPVPHNADVTLKFAPVVDGVELAELPRALYRAGRVNPVDMVVGTNLNEAALFVCQKVPPSAPAAAYKSEILKFFGDDVADRLVDLYPLSDYKLVRDAVIDVGTDFFFTCPSRHIARGVHRAGNGTNRVYRYQLRHSPDILVLSAPFYGGGWPTSYCLGVGHALDLVFVFHNLQPLLFPAEKRLADRMTAYWTNFAHSGNPNGRDREAAGVWPQYPGEDQTLALDLHDYPVAALRASKCDAIDKIQDEALSAGRALPTVRDFMDHPWFADFRE